MDRQNVAFKHQSALPKQTEPIADCDWCGHAILQQELVIISIRNYKHGWTLTEKNDYARDEFHPSRTEISVCYFCYRIVERAFDWLRQVGRQSLELRVRMK